MSKRPVVSVLPILAVCALAGAPPARATCAEPSFQTPSSERFGFKCFEAELSSTQAGSHPDLTVAFTMNTETKSVRNEKGEPERILELSEEGREIKDLTVELPPGLVGDPRAMPQCPRRLFAVTSGEAECPADTQVGVDTVSLVAPSGSITLETIGVYNLVPPEKPGPGEPATPYEFGFNELGIHGIIDFSVRGPGREGYGIDADVYDITQRAVGYNTVTIWGDPSAHDGAEAASSLLTTPTACTGPLRFGIAATSWQESKPGAPPVVSAEAETPGMTGCGRFAFGPSIVLAPDTSHAETPAGLTAEVTVPEDAGLTSPTEPRLESDLEDTTVTLPVGVTINPGQAAGLAACQPSQAALEAPQSPPSCPPASRVGTVTVETPLLPDRLEGDVYVLPSNPPNLELLVAASGDGVNVKLIGGVQLDPTTGRLTTTFSQTPPLPFAHFKLSFSGGAQAALSTPPACGVYTSAADFTPWSSPFTPDVFAGAGAFAIDAGAAGSSSCPSSPLPFSPSLLAGSSTDQAGGYADFSMLLTREDGQQRIERLQFKTPPGLLGMISSVPLCTNEQAEANACPSSSQIGHTVVEAGPGPYPLVVPEPGQPPAPIYLTEGYGGAPFGLAIVVPLHVGPFVLETQKVRASIAVDPTTAQVTVTTDPLPRIVAGVPTDLRAVDAVIDRPEFMFNPTDCEPLSFTGTASGSEGGSALLSTPFRVGSCRELSFKPDFKVSTSGKTSKRDGASLDTKVIYPAVKLGAGQESAQANIASVKVDLPRQLPSRLTTLQQACPAAKFEANPAACPAASAIGIVRASTPVLPVQLTGPVYFVSHGGEAFPSLVIVLQGDGVRVDLTAATFISKAGVTSSTFRSLPDVPVSSFELYLPQGPYSALAANGNLCRPTRTVTVTRRVTIRRGGHTRKVTRRVREKRPASLLMPTVFTAQNGAVLRQSTPIAVTGCATAKGRAAKKARVARRARKTRNARGGNRR
jgi:hypothetical protein